MRKQDTWNGELLQQRIEELKKGGRLKHFIDGLYLPSACQLPTHVSTAADVLRPVNRFATTRDPDDSAHTSDERANWAHFDRIHRAWMRGRRGEPLAAESSSGSSVFGSLEWDSDKLADEFPSEGDRDPLAYKCEYVQGPRFYKYLSRRYQKRWHEAATKRFNRLQEMDSDEFTDGVDDELKFERDIFQERVANVNGTRMLVSKAPFHPGEAGFVGKNGEIIPGPVVTHTKALTTDEMKRLDVREQVYLQ